MSDKFDALRMSVNHEWGTPRSVFDPLHAEFNFTLDAAASVENHLLPRKGRRMSDCDEHNFRYAHIEQSFQGAGANVIYLYVVICNRCGEVRKVEAKS